LIELALRVLEFDLPESTAAASDLKDSLVQSQDHLPLSAVPKKFALRACKHTRVAPVVVEFHLVELGRFVGHVKEKEIGGYPADC
jgi:hypothetical protein